MTLLGAMVVFVLLGAPPEPVRSATPTTDDERPRMKASKEDEAKILTAYRALKRAMVDGDTDRLGALMHDDGSLTHITGFVQPKREWLAAIQSGEMRYHEVKERSVTVEVTGDSAVLVGRNEVDATIYGSRNTWKLQLTTTYERRDGAWIAMRTVATTY